MVAGRCMHSNLERSRECSLYYPCGSTVETGSCSNSRRRTGRTLVETFPEEAYLGFLPTLPQAHSAQARCRTTQVEYCYTAHFRTTRNVKLTRSAKQLVCGAKVRLARRDEVRDSGGASRPVPGPPQPHILSLQSRREQGLMALYVSFVAPLLFLRHEELLHYTQRSLNRVSTTSWDISG